MENTKNTKRYLNLSKKHAFKRILLEYKNAFKGEFNSKTRRIIKSRLIPRYLKKRIINKTIEIAHSNKEENPFLWNQVINNIYAYAFEMKSPWLDAFLLNNKKRDKERDFLIIADIKRKSDHGMVKLYSRVRALAYLHTLLIKESDNRVRSMLKYAELGVLNKLIGVKYV